MGRALFSLSLHSLLYVLRTNYRDSLVVVFFARKTFETDDKCDPTNIDSIVARGDPLLGGLRCAMKIRTIRLTQALSAEALIASGPLSAELLIDF